MEAEHRPLRRPERALAYGVAGWAAEVAFTGAKAALIRRDRRARAHTYLWMLPIYGLAACGFEPLHDAVRSRPWWQRALAYSAASTAVEYATGVGLRRLTGLVPWDYSGRSPLALPGGAVRLDYLPLWGVAGLAFERLHDMLRATWLVSPATTPW